MLENHRIQHVYIYKYNDAASSVLDTMILLPIAASVAGKTPSSKLACVPVTDNYIATGVPSRRLVFLYINYLFRLLATGFLTVTFPFTLYLRYTYP